MSDESGVGAAMYARLTGAQRKAMDSVDRAVSEQRRMMLILDSSGAALRREVHDALKVGVPARLIASRLGVSKQRVYQMRDEVAR